MCCRGLITSMISQKLNDSFSQTPDGLSEVLCKGCVETGSATSLTVRGCVLEALMGAKVPVAWDMACILDGLQGRCHHIVTYITAC